MKILKEYNLQAQNSFGLASFADRCVIFTGTTQLAEISELARHVESVRVMGGGSNVILPSQLLGLTILVKNKGIQIDDKGDYWLVEAAAGELWHNFVRYTLQRGCFGLENLALIPGTVGAAPVQNIGAYGVELARYVESVDAWNIPQALPYRFMQEECQFAYRDSFFKHAPQGEWLITKVTFKLPKNWEPILNYPDLQQHPLLQTTVTAQRIFDAVVSVRQNKLPNPKLMGNAGSFFKNPVVSTEHYQRLVDEYPQLVAYPMSNNRYKLAAGWLIDRAGWRGKPLGNVAMHASQALVMTNLGGGNLADVRELSQRIKDDVWERFGVELEQEPINF